MPVMNVRIVGMPVRHPGMSVDVSVRLAGRERRVVLVLMVLVVDMDVLVQQLVVRVLVLVALGEVQVESDRHQPTRDDERDGDRFAEGKDRDHRPDEGRER